MANFNKVILAGNLTRDPELSYTANNTAICKFGMAINRKWRDQAGELRDDTCFVDLTAFGRQGENINQYMSKGRPLLVEGRLNFSQWTGQDGQKRSKLEVVVENSQFLGGRNDGGSGGGGGAAASRPARQERQDHASSSGNDDYAPAADGDSEIPF